MVGPMLVMLVLGLLAGTCIGLLAGVVLADRHYRRDPPPRWSEHRRDRLPPRGPTWPWGEHPRGFTLPVDAIPPDDVPVPPPRDDEDDSPNRIPPGGYSRRRSR